MPCSKIANLRIFPDYEGSRPALYWMSAGSGCCLQFLLYADCRKGRRPVTNTGRETRKSLDPLFERFVDLLRAEGLRVETGIFQTEMLVEIHNDVPVTVIVEKEHDS